MTPWTPSGSFLARPVSNKEQKKHERNRTRYKYLRRRLFPPLNRSRQRCFLSSRWGPEDFRQGFTIVPTACSTIIPNTLQRQQHECQHQSRIFLQNNTQNETAARRCQHDEPLPEEYEPKNPWCKMGSLLGKVKTIFGDVDVQREMQELHRHPQLLTGQQTCWHDHGWLSFSLRRLCFLEKPRHFRKVYQNSASQRPWQQVASRSFIAIFGGQPRS